nr:MAG TPA: hypothetical protein [Caudoviricetes sp.]
MKEDSIEDDIKNAEHFIDSIKTDKEYKEENGWHGYYNKEIVELTRILEHILSDYKRVLKENEELKETYKSEKKMKNEYVKLYQDLLLKENVIPVQKVKDKIEEYKNMLKTCNKVKDIDRIKAINERILELEELLEGRK